MSKKNRQALGSGTRVPETAAPTPIPRAFDRTLVAAPAKFSRYGVVTAADVVLIPPREYELADVVVVRGEVVKDRFDLLKVTKGPIPMHLFCPGCGERHIDDGIWATRPHKTHACQNCGICWRPAIVETVGVRFLPGFKNS